MQLQSVCMSRGEGGGTVAEVRDLKKTQKKKKKEETEQRRLIETEEERTRGKKDKAQKDPQAT